MHLTIANGTAQQQQWVHDALAVCTYPFDDLPALNVTVSFETLTKCALQHTYMCTSGLSGNYLIQIETWADDPTFPDNQGLPGGIDHLHEFFMDSFIHELGHVVQTERLVGGNTLAQACACFAHLRDGRRGTVSDYSGTEATLTLWADLIKEAISEWFRLAFHQVPQVYDNRTNWHLSPADYETCFALLMPPKIWRYDTPITLASRADWRFYDTPVVSVTEGGGTGYPNFVMQTVAKTYPFSWSSAPYGAYDFRTDVTAEDTTAAQVFQPGWGTGGAGPVLLEVSGNDQYSGTPSQPATFVLSGPYAGEPWQVFDITRFPYNLPPATPDLFLLNDPNEPWATEGHGSAPLYGGLDQLAHSAWFATQAANLVWVLPPHHGWGFVELQWKGQYLGNPDGTAFPEWPQGDTWNLYANGAAAAANPPWGTDPIEGNGPFFDGTPPPPEPNGYQQGFTNIVEEDVTITDGFLGKVRYYLSTDNVVIYPPGMAPGPTPTDGTATTITSRGGYTDWPTAPGDSEQEQLWFVWTGAAGDADTVSNFEVGARFFPVLGVAQAQPPPYPYFAGRVVPGPVSSGVVRSKVIPSSRAVTPSSPPTSRQEGSRPVETIETRYVSS